MLALLVDEEVDDGDRRLQEHLTRTLARPLLLELAQDLQREAVVGADDPGAVAMRAGRRRRLDHAGTQPLAAHLQKAEAGDAADLDPRPVGFQLFLQALLDGGVVAPLLHVDEVDDDKAGKVAQAQLARHLFGGLDVGLERGLLDRAFLGRAPRVHVDGHQGLGHADDDIAAGAQLHRRVEHRREVAFDLEAGEERQALVVVLHVLGMGRHDHLHEVLGRAVALDPLDEHLVDVLVVKVADRALDEVALFVDRRRGDRLQRQLADLFPEPHEVFVVALDLGLGPLAARRADDEAGAVRHLDLVRDLLQLLAVGGVGDLARDAAAARGVRHQHAVAAGEAEIGRERSTLVAAFFLDHLDQHDLPDLDHFLDLVLARPRLPRLADLLAHILVGDGFDVVVGVGGVVGGDIGLLALGRGAGPGHGLVRGDNGRRLVLVPGFVAVVDQGHAGDVVAGRDRVVAPGLLGPGLRPAAPALAAAVLLGLERLGIGALLGQKRLPVGDGDLVVVGMDFREGEEAVAVAAVIDEGRLERGFDPGDLR